MKKQQLILLCVNLLFLISCNQHVENSELSMKIKIDVKRDNKYLTSKVIEKIEYIPIQTDTNKLIGWIDKLLITEKNIIIHDNSKSRAVFFCDNNGHINFVQRSSGEGPRETKFVIDIYESNKTIILDSDMKRLYFTPEGNYIKEEKTDNVEWPSAFIQIDSTHYASVCMCMLKTEWNKQTNFGKNNVRISDDFLPMWNILILDKDFKGTKGLSKFTYNLNYLWPQNPFFKIQR